MPELLPVVALLVGALLVAHYYSLRGVNFVPRVGDDEADS